MCCPFYVDSFSIYMAQTSLQETLDFQLQYDKV